MQSFHASLLSAALLAAAPAVAQEDASAKAEKATVQLVRLSGSYADLPEAGMSVASLLTGGGGTPKAFYEVVDKLAAISGSDKSKTVLFDLSSVFSMGFPQLREMERSIAKLRDAGKRCVAYLENASNGQYLIASQCDEVLMADMGTLDFGSPAMGTMFFKDALDLLGVDFQVVRCGDFKGAVEPYVLPEMSKHLRQHYVAMLETMNADIVRRVARGRKITPQVVRAMQRQRMIPASQALEHKLVDRVVRWRGARSALDSVLGDDDYELVDALKKKKRSINPMVMLTQLFQPKREKKVRDESIAVLHLSGAIVDGKDDAPGSIVSGPTVALVRRVAQNEKIKGVVVRINSPGGSATASEAILLALKDLAEAKPVVCSMGDLAASGGYYVTCFGAPILAEVGTITGSIGVFGMKPTLGALMRRVGVRQELVSLDEGASLNAIDRPWTDEQKQTMQAFVNEIYDRFIGHVAASRKLTKKRVLEIAGGRVWSGEQAVQLGLVDKIGGLAEALAIVRERADLGSEIEVAHMPEPRSPFAALSSMFGIRAMLKESLLQNVDAAVLDRIGQLATPLTILEDALGGARPTRVWAVMPVELRLR